MSNEPKTREELEREKIEVELLHLKRPYLKTPTFWLSVVPLLFALFGLVLQAIAWDRDRQSLELKSEKAVLDAREADVDRKIAEQSKDEANRQLAETAEKLKVAEKRVEELGLVAKKKLDEVAITDLRIKDLSDQFKKLQTDMLDVAKDALKDLSGSEGMRIIAAAVDPTNERKLWIATSKDVRWVEDTDGDKLNDLGYVFAVTDIPGPGVGHMQIKRVDKQTTVTLVIGHREWTWSDADGDGNADK